MEFMEIMELGSRELLGKTSRAATLSMFSRFSQSVLHVIHALHGWCDRSHGVIPTMEFMEIMELGSRELPGKTFRASMLSMFS